MTITLSLALASPIAIAQSSQVPARSPTNLIVAAYNIQFLGQRNHDLDKLAQVIQHFDVCGIEEVKDETEIPKLACALESLTGEDWGYVYGVRTYRPGGRYHEAFAVVWRRDRAQLGDGVVSNIWDLEEAYRNDPFIASFVSANGNFDFTLMLIHTRWTDDVEGTRAGEVSMVVDQLSWMQDFMPEQDWLIAGDFNYSGQTTQMQAMANEAGLVQLDPNHKSTFKADNSGYANSYDHIYAIDGATTEFITGSSGALDATKLIYGSNSKTNMKKSKKELSDHLPVWAVFDTSGPDDD